LAELDEDITFRPRGRKSAIRPTRIFKESRSARPRRLAAKDTSQEIPPSGRDLRTEHSEGRQKKLRAAVPASAILILYKTPEEFNAVIRDKKELEWVQHELESLLDAEPAHPMPISPAW
jgi:hypothetical protein